MAKFDSSVWKSELSEEQLSQVSGGVWADFTKVGMSGGLDVTPAYIDSLAKSGQLSGLIGMFGYAGSYYVNEIKALYNEYKGSGYTMPAELDTVLKQFI